jgi:hypothetical protein
MQRHMWRFREEKKKVNCAAFAGVQRCIHNRSHDVRLLCAEKHQCPSLGNDASEYVPLVEGPTIRTALSGRSRPCTRAVAQEYEGIEDLFKVQLDEQSILWGIAFAWERVFVW